MSARDDYPLLKGLAAQRIEEKALIWQIGKALDEIDDLRTEVKRLWAAIDRNGVA
jgi:hypothetical protein